MTKKEKLKKRIREIKFAIKLVMEDQEYHEKIMGGSEELEKWLDYQLKFLKTLLEEYKKL